MADFYSTSIGYSKDSQDSGYSDNALEISGYLSKKSSKGLFNHRFFATDGKYLFYWTDKAKHDAHEPYSERYDICEIMHIDKTSNKGFILFFMNNKFKLELRAMSDEQLTEWVEFLLAKKSLYSIDELLVDLSKQRISFKTKTFQSLMILREKDQNRFILDRLEEYFKVAADESLSGRNRLKPNSHSIIQSARKAILEFKATCKECFLEINCRNPKVIAHCRNYVRRYADILRGRITLELLCIPGAQEKRFEEMGEKSICSAIELMNEVDELREFVFLPLDFISSINSTLFNSGQLISALLNISLQRIDAFFTAIAVMEPPLRPPKLLDVMKAVSESLQAVEIDKQYPQLLRTLLTKLVTSQLLSFSDQLTMLSFDNYDEATLVAHINVCEKLKELFLASFIAVSSQSIESSSSSSPVSEDRMPLPAAILDAVSSACNGSGRAAALRAVQNMTSSASDLLAQGMLQDRMSSWISGGFCAALIDRLHNWVIAFTDNLHPRYKEVLFVETCRLLITVYVTNMISCYKSNKHIKVSSKGIEQIIADMQTLHSWTVEHISQHLVQFEANFLLMLIQFLFSGENNLITCFSESVQMFGLQYSLHIYDILRLMLKYRMDLTSSTRHSVLGLCGEFLNQLQTAVAADPNLLGGEITAAAARADASILEKLCPQAGIEHCTGKKWKVEVLADPVPVRLTVALLVNQACNTARDRRREMQVKAIPLPKNLEASSSGTAEVKQQQKEVKTANSKDKGDGRDKLKSEDGKAADAALITQKKGSRIVVNSKAKLTKSRLAVKEKELLNETGVHMDPEPSKKALAKEKVGKRESSSPLPAAGHRRIASAPKNSTSATSSPILKKQQSNLQADDVSLRGKNRSKSATTGRPLPTGVGPLSPSPPPIAPGPNIASSSPSQLEQETISTELLLDQALLSSDTVIDSLSSKLEALRQGESPAQVISQPSNSTDNLEKGQSVRRKEVESNDNIKKPTPPPKPKKPTALPNKPAASAPVPAVFGDRTLKSSSNPFDDSDGESSSPDRMAQPQLSSSVNNKKITEGTLTPQEAFAKLLEAAKKDLVFSNG